MGVLCGCVGVLHGCVCIVASLCLARVCMHVEKGRREKV